MRERVVCLALRPSLDHQVALWAFEYGSISFLLRLEDVEKPASSLICLGGAWVCWAGTKR